MPISHPREVGIVLFVHPAFFWGDEVAYFSPAPCPKNTPFPWNIKMRKILTNAIDEIEMPGRTMIRLM
jgi:hypothetical protein